MVFRVAGKVPTPLVSTMFAGNTAAGSELVKWTVPAYPVAVAFDAVSISARVIYNNPVESGSHDRAAVAILRLRRPFS